MQSTDSTRTTSNKIDVLTMLRIIRVEIPENGEEQAVQSFHQLLHSVSSKDNAPKENKTIVSKSSIETNKSQIQATSPKVQQSASSYFSDPDFKCRSELTDILVNKLENGKSTGVSPLNTSEDLVLPFGDAKYTAEERQRRLQQIAFVNTGVQKIGPGCSTILDIIADELRESYLAFQKCKLCLQQKERGKSAIDFLKKKIESLIGFLGNHPMGKFQKSLNFMGKDPQQKRIQQYFLSSRRNFLEDNGELCEEAAFIMDSKEGKRIINALNLLEDFVTQEMHRLFSPLDETLDVSDHFSRLYRRANFFQRVLEDEEGFNCFNDKILIKKHSELLKRQNTCLIGFCHLILPGLSKLQKNIDGAALADLWVTLESLYKDLKMIQTAQVLHDHLDLEWKKNIDDCQNSINFVDYFRLCLRYNEYHSSLKDEAYLVILINLIKTSQVSNQEIDACIEKLIELTTLIFNHKTDQIELRLRNLPENDGDTHALRNFWKADFITNKARGLSEIEHLKLRLQRCKNNLNDQLERALALRDALIFIGGTMSCKKNLIDEWLTNAMKALSEQQKDNSEAFILVQEIYDFNCMQTEGFLAAMEGVKALIGRCFMQMNLNAQKEDMKNSKIFELESNRARKVGEGLIRSERIPSKKKNRQKRVPTPQPTWPKEIKPEPKQPQERFISAKSVQVDLPQKALVAEVKQSTPKNQVESIYENLSETSISLLQCETLVTALKKSQFAHEDCWQNHQLQNLGYWIDSLLETQGKQEFSVDLIFEQTDLLRRSIEALLGVATVFIGTSHEEAKAIGHDTEALLGILVKDPNVPENIRILLWKLRNVPITLADANRCVNYPSAAKLHSERLGEDGRQLINFLMEVDHEGHAQKTNDILRKSQSVQHERSLQRGAYFMERLLTALLDPSKMVDGELPIEESQKALENSKIQSESSSLAGIAESTILSEDLIEDNLKINSINNREEALFAIDTALVWIGIRSMAPVEGYPLFQWRMDERNIALCNSEIYLRRLKEKLGPDRNLRPMSTILGQCQLMRRCQKELLIAALYHTDSFVDGQHLVEARDIRFTNSPAVLMSILRKVSTKSKELPSIGHWMHQANQLLSYPTSQVQKSGDFSADQLKQLIDDVRQASRELRLYSQDETLVLNNGKKTPEKRLQERIELVKENERQRIFPGLAAFLHTLKYGLSVPRHKHLNSGK